MKVFFFVYYHIIKKNKNYKKSTINYKIFKIITKDVKTVNCI